MDSWKSSPDVCSASQRFQPDEVSTERAPLEVERGIDVSLIRAKFRLTPAERVRELVAAAQTLQSVRMRESHQPG